MINLNKRRGIGHLAYALLVIIIIVIVIIIVSIVSRQSQLQSQANAEVTYFDSQQPIPTQSCAVLISNQARANHDASLYASFESSGYFQNIANQYLSEIQSKGCST